MRVECKLFTVVDWSDTTSVPGQEDTIIPSGREDDGGD